MTDDEIIKQIKNKIKGLNDLFDMAASSRIRFECEFDQSKSFGEGPVAHLVLRAFKEM